MFSDVIISFSSLVGLSDYAYIVQSVLPMLAPMGLVLFIYVRRHAIRHFLIEARQQGITKALEAIANRREEAGPKISDPLASKISWTPLKPSLVHRPMKLQLSPEALVILYRSWPFYRAGIFVLVAISLAALPYWARYIPLPYFSEDEALMMFIDDASPVLLVLGVILAGLGVSPWFGIYQQTTIDKRTGTIKQVKPEFALRKIESISVWLRNAYAIQLLSYKTNASNEDVSNLGYEMNVVLNDGQRLYLMSSDSLDELLRDAQITADYLNLPLWNRTHIIYDAKLAWLQTLDEKDR